MFLLRPQVNAWLAIHLMGEVIGRKMVIVEYLMKNVLFKF